MKLEDGVTVYIGGKSFQGEVPDEEMNIDKREKSNRKGSGSDIGRGNGAPGESDLPDRPKV